MRSAYRGFWCLKRSDGDVARCAHLLGSAQCWTSATRVLTAQTSEPALLEVLAGLDWGVDRRDLAERVGQGLFYIPTPPVDQLALQLVLGKRGRDQVER